MTKKIPYLHKPSWLNRAALTVTSVLAIAVSLVLASAIFAVLLVVGLALRPSGKGLAASLLLGMSAAALLLVIAKITHQEVIEHESLEGYITESKCQND